MELRTYKFRLYPSHKQAIRLFKTFDSCKFIYNDLLALSKDSYRFGKVSLSKFDLNAYISGKNIGVHSQVIQNVSDRLHKAMRNFFRRVKDKSCKRKGFPRYKSRVKSITFPQSGFKFLNDKRLQVSKVGSIPIILHRVPKGKIKTLTIKRNDAGQWFATFSCEVSIPTAKHSRTEKVGVDLGIESFATLSNGIVISNPRFLLGTEKKLKLLHRRLSRKKKGSRNRCKARFKLARTYNKLANQRSDWLHKQSKILTMKYSSIVVEDLSVKNMVRNHCLAKHIYDASWNTFMRMLEYKAVTCGSTFIKVNPRNTSKTCSGCGTVTEMPLAKRTFLCPNCGFVVHRDLNASINILGRAGLARTHTPVETSISTKEQSFASAVIEAGTIYNDS